jgi:LmbE family N-acetylglucosaminyl deacetylase
LKDFLKNSLLRFTSKLVYRKLREATLSDLFEKKSKIMVLAPHPDDEIIGVGGIILEALTKQGQVHIVFLTDGESSGASSDKEQVKVERKKLTQNVISKLRLNENDITRLELEDGKVPHENDVGFDEIAQRIAKIMDEWKPDILFATHEKDFWPFDHVACAQLAKEAVYQSESKPKLYFYWVWACYHLKPWKLS